MKRLCKIAVLSIFLTGVIQTTSLARAKSFPAAVAVVSGGDSWTNGGGGSAFTEGGGPYDQDQADCLAKKKKKKKKKKSYAS